MTRKGIARILVRLVVSGAAGNLLGRRACQIYEAGDVDEGLVNTYTVWTGLGRMMVLWRKKDGH